MNNARNPQRKGIDIKNAYDQRRIQFGCLVDEDYEPSETRFILPDVLVDLVHHEELGRVPGYGHREFLAEIDTRISPAGVIRCEAAR